MTKAVERRLPVWAIALLVGALMATVAAAAVSLGGPAQAQVGTEARDADLKLTKSINPKQVRVGDRQTFNIRVTNERGATARGVVMTDPLPEAVRFIRARTSRQVPGSCANRNRVVRCDLGSIRVDRSVTIDIFVEVAERGTYRNVAYVEHRTAEIQVGDNFDEAEGTAKRRQN